MKRINESSEYGSTILTISNDIGSSIQVLYDRAGQMLQKYHDNNGTIKGSGKIIGGAKSQWFQTFYVNRLDKELHHLVEYRPKHTKGLREFLRTRPRRFSDIEKQLPPILIEVGGSLGQDKLVTNAKKWIESREKLNSLMASLKSQEDTDTDTANTDSQEVPQKKSKEKNDIPGKQNSQVEELVNSILNDLPKKQASEIRHAIARSDNKLQALAVEMNKRGIKT